MTRTAIYHATPNHIVEEPAMEKPESPAEILGKGPDVYFLQARQRWRDYNAHLASLRTIPCHESARSLWRDGQKVEEGKDYEVKNIGCINIAFPLPVKGMTTNDWMKVEDEPVKSEDDLPENSLILTAFQNEPVSFLLSNALRHLTQDQQMQLCSALRERLPTPASIEDENVNELIAEGRQLLERKLPPHDYGEDDDCARMYELFQEIADACARMYTGEIERLKAENSKMRNALEWYADAGNYLGDNGELVTAWKQNENIKNRAVEAIKTLNV